MATYKAQIGPKTVHIVGARNKVRSIVARLRRPLNVQQYKIDGDFETWSPFTPLWEWEDKAHEEYKGDVESYIQQLPEKINTRSIPADLFSAADRVFHRYVPTS